MSQETEFTKKYGEWALVVGASQGLGAAFADNCAKRGFNVAICARRKNKLDEVAQGLRDRYGVETRQITADITKEDCAEQIAVATEDLDIGLLIFNAAVEPGGPFVQIRLEDHMSNIAGNCVTPTKLTWMIARKMEAKHRGGIFLVSSMAGLGGIANWVSYGAGKGYELLLAEGLWYELKKYGIDAAAYVVGTTETPEFKATQEKHGTGLTGESDAEALDGKVSIPRTPESVAAALFDQMGDGPRIYSHPDDEKISAYMMQMSRAEYVNMMSSTTTTFFLGGRNELLEPIE